MQTKRVLLLCGDGFNCEFELKKAFEKAGGEVHLIHIFDFLKNPDLLLESSIFAIPGGFSFGDEIRSGKILAEKVRPIVEKNLKQFLQQKGLIIGVCNGFQVLIQLGVFEHRSGILPKQRTLTLATNNHGQFRDLWTDCTISELGARCSPWLKNLGNQKVILPIRNKEGRLVVQENSLLSRDVSWISSLTFDSDVNGSFEHIAGIVDETGQIFGLMPHPEAALEDFLYPVKNDEANANNAKLLFKIFENAINF